jgi:hypothetical protein
MLPLHYLDDKHNQHRLSIGQFIGIFAASLNNCAENRKSFFGAASFWYALKALS